MRAIFQNASYRIVKVTREQVVKNEAGFARGDWEKRVWFTMNNRG
jgi:hypothetical protein